MERSFSLPSRAPARWFRRRIFSAPAYGSYDTSDRERPTVVRRDWDWDWDCENVASSARIGLDVWGVIDRSVCQPETSKGTSTSSSAVAPQSNVGERVDGDIWDFVNDGLAKFDKGRLGHVDGDIWSFLSRGMSTSKPPSGYAELLEEGWAMSAEVRAACHRLAWWSHEKTLQGASIFVLAPRELDVGGDKLRLSMHRLIAYALSVLHEHVVKQDKRFVLVWVQLNDLGMWPHSAWKLKNSLHGMYAKNVDAVHVVHPSWTTRVVELALCASSTPSLERIGEKLYCHERLRFLEKYFSLKALGLPSDMYDHDDLLDIKAEMARRQAEIALEHGFGQHPWEYRPLSCREM